MGYAFGYLMRSQSRPTVSANHNRGRKYYQNDNAISAFAQVGAVDTSKKTRFLKMAAVKENVLSSVPTGPRLRLTYGGYRHVLERRSCCGMGRDTCQICTLLTVFQICTLLHVCRFGTSALMWYAGTEHAVSRAEGRADKRKTIDEMDHTKR